ncbi:MAG: phosphatidate cytidylyltransferase [Thermomicrobiales bacterium]
MRQRSISAGGVVIVGLVPVFLGGPVLAAALTVICLIGFFEFLLLVQRLGYRPVAVGFAAVPAFAVTALADGGTQIAVAIAAASLIIPITVEIFEPELTGAVVDWSVAFLGALYLGIPVYAAVALRGVEGSVEREWLRDLDDWTSFGWDAAPRGMAWLLLVILVTWLSDTGAYLIGRAVGRRPLIPVVSPNKTWEGLIGGLVFAAGTGALCVWLLGLEINPLAGIGIGLIIAVAGVVGDLAESVIKRQAGVKDSGSLIPGHGGMLDRVDALLFTFPAGWLVASLVDRFVR